jgi:hypothetical protein
MTPQERPLHIAYVRNEGRLCRRMGRSVPLWLMCYMQQDTKLMKHEVIRAFRQGWRNP